MGFVINTDTVHLTVSRLLREEPMRHYPRLAQTDETAPAPNVETISPELQAQLLAWLKGNTNIDPQVKLGIKPSPEPTASSPRLSVIPESVDTRTASPGVNQIVTLRQFYTDLYSRAKDTKSKGSWSGYRTLLRYWERYHSSQENGDESGGLCVVTIDKEALQAFFESVPEWQSERSWQGNRDLMFAPLKSCCVESQDNPFGRSRQEAIISRDDLPMWKLPPSRWFRDRPKAEAKASQKRGGHRRRRIPLLKVEEFGHVLKSCEDVEFMHPLW